MSWSIDPHATRIAAKAFSPHRPVVRRNGRQYVIESTAFGKVEVIPLSPGKCLAAAESPPQAMSPAEQARLAPDVLVHLRRNNLQPWKVVPAGSFAETLQRLGEDRTQASDRRSALPSWLAYGCEITKRPELLGRNRLPQAEQLAAMVDAHAGDTPLPVLIGPAGVGKRTVMLSVARRLGLSAVELPLRRVLTDRVLQTPMECLLDIVLKAGTYMTGRDLLVVSDAELIATLPRKTPQHVLAELNRLPNVVMLADTDGWASERTPGLVPLACPGLADVSEAGELLRAHGKRDDLAGAALSMVCRAATVPAIGIVPGRLLYLVRLAKAMATAEGSAGGDPLPPDGVASAIRLAEQSCPSPDPDV